MTIFLDSASSRSFLAERDPTVNDYSIEVSGGFTVIPEIGNWWKNISTNKLFQCTSINPGVSVAFENKPSLSSGSFTPVLEFGNESTGIAYTTQTGNYVKVGDSVSFNIYIALSAKGSSQGDATITGLPFAIGSTPSAFTIYFHNCDLNPTYSSYGARMAPSQQFIRLFEMGPLLPLQNLTDSLFQNNTQFFISGTYFI